MYIESDPLVDDYLEIFPSLTRQQAADNLNAILDSVSRTPEPATPSTENEKLAEIVESVRNEYEESLAEAAGA